MGAIFVLLTISLVFEGQPLTAQEAERSGAWAIVGATILDGRGGNPILNGTIVVDQGVIRCVGTRSACPSFGVLSIIEGTGLWVMPGLIDPDVRMTWAIDSAAVQDAQSVRLAVGITLVREAGSGGEVESNLRARTRAVDPFRPEPKILVTGAIESKGAQEMGASGLVDAARMLARRSVDGLRVTGLESGPQLDSIFRIAKSWAIPVYGGAPGARLKDDEVIALAERGVRAIDAPEAVGRGSDEMFDSLVKRDVALTPLLTAWQNDGMPEPHLPELHFLNGPRPVLELLPFVESAEQRKLAEARVEAGGEFANASNTLRSFQERGGVLLAGSGRSSPGSGLLVELGLLQDAGLEASDLVTLATYGAARELGVHRRFGSIQPGLAADLLMLNADPAEDIRNTQKVWRVVKSGVIYDPIQLLEPHRLRYERQTRNVWKHRAGGIKWVILAMMGIGAIVWYRRKNAWRL